jgi:signal transduction histidine kinase
VVQQVVGPAPLEPEVEDEACPRPGRAALAAMAAGSVLLVGLQLAAMIAAQTPAELLAVDVSVAVVGLAALPALVSRAASTTTFLGLLAALSPTATPLATMGAFQVARVARLRTAALVAGCGVAGHLALGLWRPITSLPWGWYALLVVAVYAMLVGWGRYSQARSALIRSLAVRAQRAETEQAARVTEARLVERAELAREMHDVLAHRLSLLATYAGALEYRPDSAPDRIAAAAGVVRAGIHEALQELREVITVLREDTTDDAAGALVPQSTLLDLPRLLDEARTVGTEVSLHVAGYPDPAVELPPRISRAGYRLVQEGLTNARRHAPGEPVRLELLRTADRLEMTLTNPLPAVEEPRETGYGLVGLAERVELEHGTFTAGIEGREFRLHAEFGWAS